MEPAPTTTNPFTIGILGCARIAKKNCRAATSAACHITAVASRNKEKAQEFVHEVLGDDVDERTAPIIFAGGDAYDQMLRSDRLLEAVYMPLPTKLHEQYVARTLSSGKHVLLEKPVAVSSASYQEMVNAATSNSKLLMDGTMFVHHPRTTKFATSIPNPNRVEFNFTFDGGTDFLENDVRVKKDADCLGCIGDLGWYCVRMGLLVFTGSDADLLRGAAMEAQVTRCHLNEEGVPLDADCLVHFSANRVLSFHCSFLHPLNQTVRVSGTGSDYTAIMTDPVLPRRGDTLSYSLVRQDLVQYDEITTEERIEIQVDNSQVQEVCMWDNFATWARKIDSEAVTVDEQNGPRFSLRWKGESAEVKAANAMGLYSMQTQMVVDALMQSIQLGGTKVEIERLQTKVTP